MATAAFTPKRPKVVANVVRGCLGNLVEWYDWFTYATFSIYFASVFFPKGSPTAQLLSTAAVFAVGFLMRPLGGWLLGIYADRFGRRAALTLSVTLMSFGSLAIAFNPGYATIGIAAPVLLVVARLVQGLSVGGEFGSSAAYLAEVSTPGRRGFFSSFQYVSIILGQLSALGVLIILQTVLTDEQMSAWGWRVPFVIGAIAGLVVMYLRRSMEESEHYRVERALETAAVANGEKVKKGLASLFTEYPKQLLIVFGLAIGGTVSFYTFTTYLLKYMVNTAGIPKDSVSVINFFALFLFMLMQPFVGHLSDKVGRKKIMIVFGVAGVLLTVPIMTVLGHTTNPYAAFGLMLLGLSFVSCYTALAAVIKAELFPTKVRALGVGLPHALVAAIFGGTAETVALALKQLGHESAYFWYVTACIALTLIAAILVKEPSRNSTLELLPQEESEAVEVTEHPAPTHKINL